MLSLTCGLRVLLLSAFALSALAIPLPDGEPITPPSPPMPPLDQVYITGVTYAGSGCPADSVASTLAADGSNINIAFSKYIASVGDALTPFSESRKNCQLTIQLQYPPGWSYAIYSTEFRGFVDLDDEVSAIQRSDYWFPGDPDTTMYYTTWTGPYTEDYIFTDEIPRSAVVWSPCYSGGSPSSLNINTQIRVDNRNNREGQGMITTDVINNKVTHTLGCQWKQCSTA